MTIDKLIERLQHFRSKAHLGGETPVGIEDDTEFFQFQKVVLDIPDDPKDSVVLLKIWDDQ